MKTKQIISIVITGVVIIAVGITGVASNVIGSKLIKQNKTETSSIVKDMFSSVSGDSNIELPNKDFVGVINIEGEIGASSSNSLTSDSTYNHDFYLKYIEKMEKSDKNKGILLYVDSPGGAVYETDGRKDPERSLGSADLSVQAGQQLRSIPLLWCTP